MIIGKFTRTSDGWAGTIQTVTCQTKARFVPNDKRENERAPDFRVVSGHCELGVAWRRTSQSGDREYLSVILDDPLMIAPLNVALFESPKSGEANLVWKRQQEGEQTHQE
ncbi:MAG TPA: DUF736 domain-containing protein [Rhizomicrobium sp.]|nr:DUF736 domain-containing protein [Rhizomicrobium sp.]